MEAILHRLICNLSRYLQVSLHSRWMHQQYEGFQQNLEPIHFWFESLDGQGNRSVKIICYVHEFWMKLHGLNYPSIFYNIVIQDCCFYKLSTSKIISLQRLYGVSSPSILHIIFRVDYIHFHMTIVRGSYNTPLEHTPKKSPWSPFIASW